jgi:DNA-binding transcriptional ArsR family regulator
MASSLEVPSPPQAPVAEPPNAIPTTVSPENTRWQEVEAAFRRTHHDPDMLAVRALYAAAAAHQLPGPTVWMFAVAPPSSGKTEALMPLKRIGAHIISAVTPQTFLSGWTWRKKGQSGKGQDASLLNRIRNGIIVCKDFSQVLSMPLKTKGPVLADLRDIYDGHIAKEYGTGERKEWEGRITLIAGVTQDIDLHYSVYQTLGERFVQIRWKRPGGIRAALMAMKQKSVQATRSLLDRAVYRLLKPIFASPQVSPHISAAYLRRIANLAEFTVRARTHVPRDGYSREILYMPEAEASPRLAQQFEQLARGSALLDGRSDVNAIDIEVVQRVAMDSIKADRRAILDSLIEKSQCSVTQLASAVKLSQSSISRRVEELQGLGLVESDQADSFEETMVRLSTYAQQLLAGEADD